jgi:hypothetical protein
MSMRVFSPSVRRHAVDAFELTMAERLALAFEIGGRRVQDLVVTFGISRSEAKRLIRVRDQLGRSCSPCTLAMFAATAG